MALGLLRFTFNPARRAQLADTCTAARQADGWLTDAEGMLLHELARRCEGSGAIVEIGSWRGRSTICLARGSREGGGTPVYAVDPHTGSIEHREELNEVNTLASFLHNIEKASVEDLVIPLVAPSLEAAASFEEPVELVFIDGAHDYESVRQDIAAWMPKLVTGGTVAFHDVVGEWDETWRAVHDLAVASGELDRLRFVHSIVSARTRGRRSHVAALTSRSRFSYKRQYDRLRPTIGYVGRLVRPG
ncbi:MAG: class I SAM-dependent methyltransferase [Dehalococcoidia bacterium]